MFWVAIAAPFGELISSANLKLARFPTRSPLALAALPSISLIPSPPSAAQAVTATGQPNPQEMMKQMIEMSKLNENHKLLSSLDGSWNYTIKMPGEDDKMKDVQFKGMGLEGYDNVKKKFINSWDRQHGYRYPVLRRHVRSRDKDIDLYERNGACARNEIASAGSNKDRRQQPHDLGMVRKPGRWRKENHGDRLHPPRQKIA